MFPTSLHFVFFELHSNTYHTLGDRRKDAFISESIKNLFLCTFSMSPFCADNWTVKRSVSAVFAAAAALINACDVVRAVVVQSEVGHVSNRLRIKRRERV